jgi:hypothetical protein
MTAKGSPFFPRKKNKRVFPEDPSAPTRDLCAVHKATASCDDNAAPPSDKVNEWRSRRK